MAKMPAMKPKEKDMMAQDDMFGEELSLPDDVAPETALDSALEGERVAPSVMGPDELTPEEQDILAQAADIQKVKAKAADQFMKGAEKAESMEEEAPEEGTSKDSDMEMEDAEPAMLHKKMKPGGNLY